MRRQLRIGSALSWIAAWLLALSATPLYLYLASDFAWLVVPLLALPLIFLIAWRGVREDVSSSDRGPHDGPWFPPGDHGGL